MGGELISIILPIYNQADFVGQIVDKYEGALSQLAYPHETILVVNGSTDGSLAVCNKLSAQHPSVRVLHSEQGGWGLAVKLGLNDAKGELICYTNSARTAPEDLAAAIQQATASPQVIVKARRIERDSIIRWGGSFLFNLECRVLFGLQTWDVNGTPKVFPRKFSKLLALTRDDDMIDLEFNVVSQQEKYPVLELPIRSRQRHGGKSTTRLKSALKIYQAAFEIWRSVRREKL